MKYSAISKKLDKLYFVSGLVGAVFLIAILVLIFLQMLSRWVGFHFLTGSIEYIGYAMAASSMFCLSYALVTGQHIRVNALTMKTKGLSRFTLSLWCFAIAILITLYFLYYQITNVWFSYQFNDVSQGEDATPLWIPQLVMPIGAFIFLIALVDHLIRLVLTRNSELLEK